MKSLLLICTLVFSATAGAVEFAVTIDGQSWLVNGNDYKESASSVIVEKFRMINPETGEKFLVDVAAGWGASPMNILCDALTGGKYPFAESYGNLGTPGFFDPGTVLVFEPNREDGTFKALSYADKNIYGVVYTRLECTVVKSNY